MKEHAWISGSILWYTFVTLIVIGIIGFGTMAFKPHWLGMERKAFKASHQYKESKVQIILTLKEKYDKLTVDIMKYRKQNENEIVNGLTMQQDAIKNRIKNEASLLPVEEVPSSIRSLL